MTLNISRARKDKDYLYEIKMMTSFTEAYASQPRRYLPPPPPPSAPILPGWETRWNQNTHRYTYCYRDSQFSQWNVKAEDVFDELRGEVMLVNRALHDAMTPGLVVEPLNFGTLIAYRDLVENFQNEAVEMQRRYREYMGQLLARIKVKSNRVRNPDAKEKRSLDPASSSAPSTWPSILTPVSPIVDISANSRQSRERKDRQSLAPLVNERDTSAADLAIDEIVPQGTSEPAIQMISMATEAQDPHIDIPDPPTESSSHQSKKRKRPTPKDPGKYKHECDTCGERFTRSTTLREHKRIHTNERPFACSTCVKTFTRPKDRKRHQELHTRKNKFSCDLSFDGIDGQCGRAFAREDGLVAHLRTERGWHCLQSIFSIEFLGMVAQRDARNENVFRCELTRLSCGAEFDRFVDLKKHLGEPDNKQCVVERLVKIFVDRIRSDQERECAEQKERSSTTSDSEQQRPSSPRQQSLQSQRETSPPRPPSLAVTRSEQNKLQDPLTGVENIVECVSSFGSPTEEAASEEAIKGPTPSVGLIPAREVGPDFDPFAGWVLVNSGCDSLGSSLLVWIDIKCSQHLTTNYRVGIGRDTDMSTRLIRGEFSSYRLEACFHSVEYDLVNSLEIYICYQSDGSPPRIFRVGRVRYELMVNGWKWVKVTSPAVSTDIRSEHEIPERGVTEVENAPPSFLGDIHTLQEGSKIEEVAIPRKPVGPSPQESELNTVYDRFSGWILIDSSFVEAESKIWLRIESPKPLATPPYFRMRNSTETFFEMAQCERDKHLISTCRYVFVMKISGHWFRRKFWGRK